VVVAQEISGFNPRRPSISNLESRVKGLFRGIPEVQA